MMEPDIIRMYSSSPPPLDNGADEGEEDEFGDFGGFSVAGSTSIGFDFTSDYTNSNEDHQTASNSDYAGTVDSIISFAAVGYANDKENITELPNSIKELPDSISKEKYVCKNSDSSFNVNPIEVKRIGELEPPHSEIIRTDVKATSRDQQRGSCERLCCQGVVTNGFSALDKLHPQVSEDIDSINELKTFKIVDTHNAESSLDSLPSTVEHFSSFSHKQTSQLEAKGNEIHKSANGGKVLNVQKSKIINRVGEVDCRKEVTSDESCRYEGEICTEGKQASISKLNAVSHEDFKVERDCTALERKHLSSTHPNVNSLDTTENLASIETREVCDTGNSQGHDFSWTFHTASSLTLNGIQNLSSLPAEQKMCVSEMVKYEESDTGHASSSDMNDDFGDFGTVSSGSPAFVDVAQVSVNQGNLLTTEKQVLRPSSEYGDFMDQSSSHQQSSKVTPEPNERAHALEECQTGDTDGSKKSQLLATWKDGEDGELGDFGSVAKWLPDSSDFADFSTAGCDQATEWNAFEREQKESCSWAAFGDEQSVESTPRRDEWLSHRTDATFDAEGSASHKIDNVSVTFSQETSSKELPALAQATLLSRLERIFEVCFSPVPVCEIEEEIASLKLLLETTNKSVRAKETSERELHDVWTELQDIHDAFGLRYQWGGSHSNKKLLCSLGIDTRNILFTGNKKQPLIVPMYAAGLGMLEPTKEPLKPISAAEKIASIGQTPPVFPDPSRCAPDQFQESLPPVQFDWSTSGLTNPLDASGGSTLLNLDFFGPVDDTSSGIATTIPGVDPELYELTTSKLETTTSTSKVTDAFAKLMSTVEKASTSTRKPKKEELLSEEAAKVISSLPDLTFMHAKVLMFPATLTPSTSCQDKVD